MSRKRLHELRLLMPVQQSESVPRQGKVQSTTSASAHRVPSPTPEHMDVLVDLYVGSLDSLEWLISRHVPLFGIPDARVIVDKVPAHHEVCTSAHSRPLRPCGDLKLLDEEDVR